MHDSLGAALADRKPDLAIVATPHDSHVPLAGELLRAGVPTLLEKPPARSAPELATLLRLSLELETPLATSLPLHYRDCYRHFTRLLRSPGLTDAQVSITAGVPSWPGANSWRLSRERAGGGVLIDLGYHYLELLLACLGLPDTKLVRLARAADSRHEVEDEAQVSLWFAERRIQVQLQLRSGAGAARFSELSIKRKGALLYHSCDSEPAKADPKRREASGPLPMPPAAAQLEGLLTSGFLDGRADWYEELHRQHVVMLLLDELYAAAEQMGCLPGLASVSDPAFLAGVTGLPERTPA
jgi:predicted dehydrogenase